MVELGSGPGVGGLGSSRGREAVAGAATSGGRQLCPRGSQAGGVRLGPTEPPERPKERKTPPGPSQLGRQLRAGGRGRARVVPAPSRPGGARRPLRAHREPERAGAGGRLWGPGGGRAGLR